MVRCSWTFILLAVHISNSRGAPTRPPNQVKQGHAATIPNIRESSTLLYDLNLREDEQEPGAILPKPRLRLNREEEGMSPLQSIPPTSILPTKEDLSYQSFIHSRLNKANQETGPSWRKEHRRRILSIYKKYAEITKPKSRLSKMSSSNGKGIPDDREQFKLAFKASQSDLGSISTKPLGLSKTTNLADKPSTLPTRGTKYGVRTFPDERFPFKKISPSYKAEFWKQRMRERSLKQKGKDAMFTEEASQSNLKSKEKLQEAPHPMVEEDISISSKRKVEESGPSNVDNKETVKYYQESRPPYVPPEWMSDEVKQYYKHWYDHANEVQKFNRGQRADRPRMDGKIPFVLQYALDLKKSKLVQESQRKKQGLKFSDFTEAEQLRNIQEWHMIQSGENLRMSILQLHRHAVAKELGIHFNEVTNEIGRKHGVPYGPWKVSLHRKTVRQTRARKAESSTASLPAPVRRKEAAHV